MIYHHSAAEQGQQLASLPGLFHSLICYPCFLNWQEAAALVLTGLARIACRKNRGDIHNIYMKPSSIQTSKGEANTNWSRQHEARGSR